MKNAGIRLALVVLGASLAATAACGGDRQPQTSNTYNTYSPAKIKGLDPVLADDLYAHQETSRAYEGLLGYSYLKRPYVLQPVLAESMPTESADGRVYTFMLKKGVVFQDDPAFKATGGKGREVTADDFVFSFKRVADPKLASPGWWTLDGKLVGLNEWRDAASKAGVTDYAKPVEGLKAVDRHTLQLTLTKPSHQFLFNLAQAFTFVVAREAVEAYGKELLNHAVGTGPFRLQEFTPGRLIWVRNPTFRQVLYPAEGEPGDQEAGLLADAGKPIPFVDKVVVNIYEETQPMWLNFLAGNLDVAGIPKDNYAQAIDKDGNLTPELASKGIKLFKTPLLDLTFHAFNMRDPIVGKNKLLRQALSMAEDMKGSIDLFYNGRALAAQGPIPPGLSGYDPALRNPYAGLQLEKAKETLARAGYPGGKGLPPILYLTTADSTSRQMSEFIAKNYAAIGVKVTFGTSSWPEFQQAVKNGKGQMWGMAWGADYPDGENYLQLFYSKNGSPGPNDGNYSNPDFDRLYEQSLLLADGPERNELYKRHEFEGNLAKYLRLDASK